MSRAVARAVVVLAVLQLPALARADGQPVLGYAAPSASIGSTDGTQRYLARPRGRATVVENVSVAGTVAYTIPGSFAIPMVAYDGSLGGLSADGRTLILARPRTMFPARSTELAVLDACTLRVVRLVALRGDFSFDAISPSGRWVYLIEHSSTDAVQYQVRALDTHSGRLVPHDIIDPHDRGEKMEGYPLSRISSPDGRWAYTLYAGTDSPFIHALDTPGLRARCIDVPAFPQSVNASAVRLRLTGDRLAVMVGRRTLSAFDTRSLRLTPGPGGRSAAAVGRRAGAARSWIPLIGALAAVLLAAGAATVALRRWGLA